MAGAKELLQSVQDIEGDVWPAATPEATYLVRTVHRLRQVPIGELDIEDLRIMLSQDVGTTAILPLALDQLDANPLAAGHFYPGDLLWAVLRLPGDRWAGSAEILTKVRGIAQRADAMIAELGGAQVSELRGVVLKFLSDRSEFSPAAEIGQRGAARGDEFAELFVRGLGFAVDGFEFADQLDR